MGLKFDASKIENPGHIAPWHLNGVVHACGMVIGVPILKTDKDVDLAYERIAQFAEIGVYMANDDDGPHAFSYEEVKACRGLITNGVALTERAFNKRFAEWAIAEVRRRIREEEARPEWNVYENIGHRVLATQRENYVEIFDLTLAPGEKVEQRLMPTAQFFALYRRVEGLPSHLISLDCPPLMGDTTKT